MMQPRWYQTKIVESARRLIRKHRAVIINLATGGGKTPTACWIIRLAIAKGKRVLFLAHRHELLKQASDKLSLFGIEHGLITAGTRGNILAQVQLASIQTMIRRLERISINFDLIIVDEAHLSVATSYMQVFEKYSKAKILGITGSAGRLDGRGLGKDFGGIYEAIISGPSKKQLIAEGFLVPARVFSSLEIPDMTDVPIIAGEYHQAKREAAVNKPKLIGDSVSHYLEYAIDRPFISFCCSIKHAHNMATAFRDRGIRCVALSGKDGPEKRIGVLNDLKAGLIDGITNAQLYIEGLDIPRLSCIILDSPTNSLTRYLQSIGRGERPFPEKIDYILLDHAGSVGRFGMPDEDREWTLEGRKIKKRDPNKEPSNRICGYCFSNTPSPSAKCGNCGREFPIESRQVDRIDGKLMEITSSAILKSIPPEVREKRIEQGRKKSLQDLITLGHQRKMKNPEGWARHVMESRLKKLAQKSA